jgi:hypothetical protein
MTYAIDISNGEEHFDICERAPFFTLGNIFKSVTSSRTPSEDGVVAAFLPPGEEQC